MNSIIRFLVCLFFLVAVNKIIAQPQDKTYHILLQATDKSITESALKDSYSILNKRLIAFGFQKTELIPSKDKTQISLQLSDNQDLGIPEYLLTSKGSLAFYETYSRSSLMSLFKENKPMLALLNKIAKDSINANSLACIPVDRVAEINQLLNRSGDNIYCLFAWGEEPENASLCLYALKITTDPESNLKSSDIKSINIVRDYGTGHHQVNMEFTAEAKAKWATLTARNINKPIAVTIDNKVYFAPVLRSKIENAQCVISGDFTKEQLMLFSAIANNGELPSSFTIVK
ncbi:MAG TPA: hypothetical protein VK590_15570 [Saprospiraceae bacterium]|nr:hypothetical protein [Saprospiraceae bacterium]